MKTVTKRRLAELEVEYKDILPKVNRLMQEMRHQIETLAALKEISLGVPIECRIKSWESIEDKIVRRSLKPQSIKNIPDLIGIRVILLFKRDVDAVCKLLNSTFQIIDKEDKEDNLGVSQFGYTSVHYRIKQPNTWNSVPSFADTGAFQTEVQVRTLAQHIWAMTSHVLQYKNEESVPRVVLRSINRVAAILETADLEFERVLGIRENYLKEVSKHPQDDELNVDLIASILDELLPPQHKSVSESYSALLKEFLAKGIRTANQLRALIEKHKDAALKDDAQIVKLRKEVKNFVGTTPERITSGVFFTHTGLSRQILASLSKTEAVN
jgi:ppGpp synthetase/RelA/SpoT-type nucleotidyltranferase